MRNVHIEKKALSSTESTERLRAALVGQTGNWITRTEAAVMTGLPLTDAEAALLSLSTLLPCRVGVSDDGLIAVRFDSVSVPGPDSPWRARTLKVRAFLRRHRDAALAVFTMAVLPIIATTGLAGAMAMATGAELRPDVHEALRTPILIVGGLLALGWVLIGLGLIAALSVTFIAFGVMCMPIVATITPFMTDGKASNPDFSLGTHIATSIFAFVICVPLGYMVLKIVIVFVKKVLSGEKSSWAPKFWRSIGGLSFGPTMAKVDRLADEKRVLGRVAELEGVVTTPDLMGLFGWSPAEAESEVMRVMLDYGGDVAVTEDGTVLWVFPEFRPATRSIEALGDDDRAVSSTTQRPNAPAPKAALPGLMPPTPPRFFGCTRRFAFVALLLVIPAFIGPAFHPALYAFPSLSEMWTWHGVPGVGEPDPVLQNFGAWPAAFVLLAILSRVPLYVRRRTQAAHAAREITLVALACEQPAGANIQLKTRDTKVLALLDAEVEPAARGLSLVRFPWVIRAREAAAAVRAGRTGVIDF